MTTVKTLLRWLLPVSLASLATACGSPGGESSPSEGTAASEQNERAFLDPSGLPGRPWYRHLLFAPKPTYAPEVLPGVTESLEVHDSQQLVTQVARLVTALGHAAALLDRSEERRVGKECRLTCRSRWSPYH